MKRLLINRSISRFITYWPCSSVGRAPACHAGGRGIETRQGRHYNEVCDEQACRI